MSLVLCLLMLLKFGRSYGKRFRTPNLGLVAPHVVLSLILHFSGWWWVLMIYVCTDTCVLTQIPPSHGACEVRDIVFYGLPCWMHQSQLGWKTHELMYSVEI